MVVGRDLSAPQTAKKIRLNNIFPWSARDFIERPGMGKYCIRSKFEQNLQARKFDQLDFRHNIKKFFNNNSYVEF